jgi:L-cystine uptake protein TcyP (sodium:dicarboxylate symporter family)
MQDIITLTGMFLIIPLLVGLVLVVVSVVEEDKKPKQLFIDLIFPPIFLGVVFGLLLAFVLCPCANWFFNTEPTGFDRYVGPYPHLSCPWFHR